MRWAVGVGNTSSLGSQDNHLPGAEMKNPAHKVPMARVPKENKSSSVGVAERSSTLSWAEEGKGWWFHRCRAHTAERHAGGISAWLI